MSATPSPETAGPTPGNLHCHKPVTALTPELNVVSGLAARAMDQSNISFRIHVLIHTLPVQLWRKALPRMRTEMCTERSSLEQSGNSLGNRILGTDTEFCNPR